MTNENEMDRIKRENEELKKKLRKAEAEKDEASLMAALWGRGRDRSLRMWGATEISGGFD